MTVRYVCDVVDVHDSSDIRDRAATFIVNVFAPRNGDEFARILAPAGLRARSKPTRLRRPMPSGRDVLLGVALIPVGLVLTLGGVYATGWLVYRMRHAAVPLWAAAVAGGALRRDGLSVRVGPDRADDL